MGYYFVKLIGHEIITIMSVDDDDDINNPNTWFWTFGSEKPTEREKIEILDGPFTIEQLYKIYQGSKK